MLKNAFTESNMEKKVSKNKWRFERKYELSLNEFIQFEKLLLLSDLKVLYEDRVINNCYLDSYNHRAYEESIEGYSEKIKTRVRWYGDFFQTTTPTLEFKLKQNNSNTKELFKLPEIEIHEQLNWKNYIETIRNHLSDTQNFMLSEKLEPVMLNSYSRSYYSNFEKTFRLTVDKDLQFFSPNVLYENQLGYKINRFIIELKFNNSIALNNFEILKNLGKFSKFTTGVRLLY